MMTKRILWMLMSCLMVLSLVVVSCGGDEDTNGTTKPDGTSSDEPQYGGTITIRDGVDPTCCDSFANKMMSGGPVILYVYEQLLSFDWSRGPAGTGEFTNNAVASPEAQMAGELVESVEKPDPETWILTIRQGVHYQDTGTEAGDLVGGREMTADDIVWAFERNVHSPDGAIQVLQPRVAAAFEIEKTGPWEVTFTTAVQPITAQWWVIEGGGYAFMYPREIVDTYGDLNDWKNSVGTGAWIMEDWVPATSISYRRNPNYWGINPVGPGKGDQLPYADSVKRLIIPDASTALASLRTGKIDMYGPATYDVYEELRGSAPDLDYLEYLGSGFGEAHAFNLRLDDPTKPWALNENGKKVRQALMMAIDYDTIVNDYFTGKADKDTVLVNRNFEGVGYVPLSSMSESVQQLYSYNPEKAKQLLAEAGFPDGFKTDVIVPGAPVERSEEVAIIKNMWAEIGVDLEIVPIEASMIAPLVTRSFEWDDMFYGTFQGGTVGSFGFSLYTYLGYYRGDNRPQFASRTDPEGTPDPFIEENFATMMENIYVNWPAAYKEVENLRPYLIENAFKIPFPQPFSYTFWWPWMKNTHGQGQAGFFMKYYWVDQDLKQEMGY
jgi:peptide/nickel transport system substrate-binding protein